jgi:hypothetical protein
MSETTTEGSVSKDVKYHCPSYRRLITKIASRSTKYSENIRIIANVYIASWNPCTVRTYKKQWNNGINGIKIAVFEIFTTASVIQRRVAWCESTDVSEKHIASKNMPNKKYHK